MRFHFETVDVFTDRRFGGNPLAVFHDAEGLSDAEMQSLAAEFNLSETTFVLPAADPANTARVRIFNRTAEMPFAGHPSIGTAFVLAGHRAGDDTIMRFEMPAGRVDVELEREGGRVVGGRVSAPQPLSVGLDFAASEIASCVGLTESDIDVSAHRPVLVSVGNPYVVARVRPDALARCEPEPRLFRDFVARHRELNGRFSLHLYSGSGREIRARMFAPLAGTIEDPATGSANAPLAGLLLSLTAAEHAAFLVRQGEEMGRPSLLRVDAARRDGSIYAHVAGRCVRVLRGEALVGETHA